MSRGIERAFLQRSIRRVVPVALLAVATLSLGGAAVLASSAGAPAPEPDREDVRVIVVDDDGKVVRVASKGGDRKGTFLGVSLGEDTKNPEGGAKVESVVDGSPAQEAGIRRGDTIVEFGGAVIRGPARLSEKIHAAEPGDKVEVKVVREDGERKTLTVELGERPRPRAYWFGSEGHPTPVPLPDLEGLEGLEESLKDLGKDIRVRSFRLPHGLAGFDRPKLGVELVEATPELREFLGADRESGVIVGKVLAGTPAERAGVRVGDVIVAVDGEAIQDAGDLIDQLAEKEGSTITLELVRDKRTIRFSVPIPKQDDESDEQAGPRASRWSDEQQRMVEAELRAAEATLRRTLEQNLAREDERSRVDDARRAIESAMKKAREEAMRARRELEAAARLRNVI